jgi:Zn-dependent protease
MLAHSLRIAEIFGIETRIKIGWAFIAALIAWSLARGIFPILYSGLAVSTYWIMATITVFGLAASIAMHQLAHSVVAVRFGCPVSRITLFMFGGVAALDQEPATPIGEFLIALAGPAMSLMLASGLYVVGAFVAEASVFANTVHYLALLNLVLAVL